MTRREVNTFGGITYRTSRDYYRAIAEAYLLAGGLNNRLVIERIFASQTDEALARDCYDAWTFENPEFETGRLIEAFADCRKSEDWI